MIAYDVISQLRRADQINLTPLIFQGNGTFTAGTNITVGVFPVPIAAITLVGQSNLDLVVADYSNNDVRVFTGNGDGTFAAGPTFSVGTSPVSLAVGDFTANGAFDLAVANGGTTAVSIELRQNDDDVCNHHVQL